MRDIRVMFEANTIVCIRCNFEAAFIPNATCVQDKHDIDAAELAEFMQACE